MFLFVALNIKYIFCTAVPISKKNTWIILQVLRYIQFYSFSFLNNSYSGLTPQVNFSKKNLIKLWA